MERSSIRTISTRSRGIGRFAGHDIVLPMWRIHRHIGMGGDQLVAAVAGDEVEGRLGDSLRNASADEFGQLRDECTALEGAQKLLAELKRRAHTVVLASSSSSGDLDHFLDLLEIRPSSTHGRGRRRTADEAPSRRDRARPRD